MLAIERGIAIPPPADNRGNTIYPWKNMQIGDSFLFPKGTRRGYAQNLVCGARHRLKRQFVVRECPDGVRCWRIEPEPQLAVAAE